MIDNGNGTVTDEATGLIWQQETIPNNTMSWRQALSYCERLNLGGHTDWRLPTIKELISLVDYRRHNPAIDTAYFLTAVVSSLYWSSTTYASDTLLAWSVYFYNGHDYMNYKNVSLYVRAVRGEEK